MKRYFVTGTGTGVGKTFVTCSMAARARARQQTVLAYKPIETGCSLIDGRLQGDDQELLHQASSLVAGDLASEHGLYQFALPAAPLVAASEVGQTIDMTRIEAVLSSAPTVDLFLVEGAGGWRVPITSRHDMSDLAKLVGGEVIVVGLASLGTINHSLLSLEAVERDGSRVAAMVLSNRPEDDRKSVESNVVEIQRRWGGRVLLSDDLDELLPFHVERALPG